MTALLVVVYVAAGIAWVVAWAEIFAKSGYNRWLCFAMIVPVVNLIVFLWFAFSKWPVYEFVEKGWQIKRLKSHQEKIEREIQSLGETEELPELTKEEKEKKLVKIREQLERGAEKAQQEERETLKHTPGKCPYCGSNSISENVIDGPLSGSKMKTFGYYYKWDCQCVDCRAKWFGVE